MVLNMTDKALVIFSGQTDFWWQRFLKPGYRHCGVVIEIGDRWVLLEPLAASLQLEVVHSTAEELCARLRHRGLRVIETKLSRDRKPLLYLRPLTCVEVVKRTLGIHALNVWTPWQLHKKIQKIGKKTLK